jgi:hypothetical protein
MDVAKSVRFRAEAELCEVFRIPPTGPIKKEELWYGSSDFELFKQTAQVICSESKRYGFGLLLNNTFQIESKEQEERIRNSLVTWTRGHSRRGLEVWINPDHGKERIKKRVRFIRTLLKAQEIMKREGHDQERMSEDLARVSKKGTFHATRFATLMGFADGKAVERDPLQQQSPKATPAEQDASLYLALSSPKHLMTDRDSPSPEPRRMSLSTTTA